MNISFRPFSDYSLSFVKEEGFLSLTDQQKKIALIFSMALSFLAICLVAARCSLKAKPLSNNNIDPNTPKPVVPLKDNTTKSLNTVNLSEKEAITKISDDSSYKVNQLKKSVDTAKKTDLLLPLTTPPENSINKTKETKKEPIDPSLREKKGASEELIKLTQKIYSDLRDLNGNPPHPIGSVSWNLNIYAISGELRATINDTFLVLNSVTLFENKAKDYLEELIGYFNEINPEILNHLKIPSIDLESASNEKFWNDFSKKHISQCNANLAICTEDSTFFKQLELSFGKKGEWFNQIFKKLKNILDKNEQELEKFSNSCEDFFKQLDDEFFNKLDTHNLSYVDDVDQIKELMDHLNKHRKSYNDTLEKLKQKIKAFELMDNHFEKIMELAQKAL